MVHTILILAWTVFIRGNQGELSGLAGTSRTNELSPQVTAKTGIPFSGMPLLFGQKVLKLNQTLESSGIKSGCSINLSVIGHGGGKGMYVTKTFPQEVNHFSGDLH